MDLTLAAPLLALLAIMWASERRHNLTFSHLLSANLMLADEYELLNEQVWRHEDRIDMQGRLNRSLLRMNLATRVRHLERSLIETPDAWVKELKNSERMLPYAARTEGPRPNRPVESLDEEAARVQPHDPRNELSAVAAEADSEIGYVRHNEGYQTRAGMPEMPAGEAGTLNPEISPALAKAYGLEGTALAPAITRSLERLNEQAWEHAREYGLPRPDFGFKWERMPGGFYHQVRIPEVTPLTMPGTWHQVDGTQLSPEESSQVDADIERIYGTGDNQVIR